MKPAAVLIRTFQVHVGRKIEAVILLQHAEMGSTGIKPDIQGVVELDVVIGIVTEQFVFIERKPGLDAGLLAQHVSATGGVANFAGATAISNATFYQTKVDLFIPAALEQMVDLEHAEQLNCKVLVEAANAPTTPRAENYLLQKGVKILPAILCNSGGVAVSYFEWKQNRQSEQWTEEDVDARLKTIMNASARRVLDMAEKLDCNMRTASYAAAIEHIDNVYETRGVFP